ncbi:MAG TPA: hydroxymethylbilane synthase [Stellaceae bacterium]|nr:hydroxymethylbilane synthase [Stellaceae bacterium]
MKTSKAGRLRIGTRGSPMALYQAGLVRGRLMAAHPFLREEDAAEIVVIRTTGDREQTRLLAEIGGKGLFTKEIEEALRDRRIDLAVHSLKDVETRLPDGLGIACVLPRDDPRDAFLSRRRETLAELPQGAVVGTASLRRRAQLLRRRPDLRIVPFRGNAGTRLAKMDAGEVEATLLALSGLQRIGLAERACEVLEPNVMLPAVAQGALAIECRADDAGTQALLAPLHDAESAACVHAERAMLAALDGSCRTPIAGLATIAGGTLTLEGLLITPDGTAEWRGQLSGPPADAAEIGRELGEGLLRDAGPGFLAK